MATAETITRTRPRDTDPDKLRARMSRAVERLIDALDALDAFDEDREDDDPAEDNGDAELSFNGDEPERDDADDEPSLGSDDSAMNQTRWNNLPPQPARHYWEGSPIDREAEQDAEPSLGWQNEGSQAGLHTLTEDGESEPNLGATISALHLFAWKPQAFGVTDGEVEYDDEPSEGWGTVGAQWQVTANDDLAGV